MKPVLVISREYPPVWTPLAKGVAGVVQRLGSRRGVEAVTGTPGVWQVPGCTVHRLTARSAGRAGNGGLLARATAEAEAWLHHRADDAAWARSAIAKARQLARSREFGCILGFMMPYVVGDVAIELKRELGLPLILSFDDSPTCSDMHPTFRTRFHYLAVRRMEERFVRSADAVVYVSAHNAQRVARGVGARHAGKIRLIRVAPFRRPALDDRTDPGVLSILYLGDFSGWHQWIDDHRPPSPPRKLYWMLKSAGSHQLTRLDVRSHSPVYLARAIQRAVAEHPEWAGRIRLRVVGNTYAKETVDRALALTGVADVVTVEDRVPAAAALDAMGAADALFLCLPDRPDGSYGGRVSAKVYDYIATSKPIIAALPEGENRELLRGVPGAFLAGPSDIDTMTRVITEFARQKFTGGRVETYRRAAWSHLCDGERRIKAYVELVDAVAQGGEVEQ